MGDIELLEQHRSGSTSAFTELVQKHIGWVYGLSRRRLRDPHLAEDVTQAVFVLLHRKAPRFPADRAMIRWLHQTAWYASRVAQRNHRRRWKHESEAAMLRPHTYESPAENQSEESIPLLDDLIARLNRTDREAILLRFYRDLSYAQVGIELGATEEAARKRVDRAIDKLRKFAGEKGLPITGAMLLSHLTDHVRIPPPHHLLTTAVNVATSKISASSASIVKGTIIMMAYKTSLVAATVVLAIVVIAGSIRAVLPPSQSPMRSPVPANTQIARTAIAPAIRWHAEIPEVQIKGIWYELVAIDDLPASKIVAAAKSMSPTDWQRQIQEDMDLIYAKMNVTPGPGNLQLRTLDSHQVITLNNVPMTHENRSLIMFGANYIPSSPTTSLFSVVRWRNSIAEVQVNGNDTWYELTAIDDEPAADIIAFAKKTYGDHGQAQIENNSLDVMIAMGHAPGLMGCWLHLRTLDSSESVTILKRIYSAPSAVVGPANAGQGYPRLSPFSAVRWQQSNYEVQINGKWYALISIDDQPLAQIVEFTKKTYGPAEVQKRIDEDLVEVLTRMGHQPKNNVKLELKNIETGEQTTRENIPLTKENRRAIFTSKHPAATPVPAPSGTEGL